MAVYPSGHPVTCILCTQPACKESPRTNFVTLIDKSIKNENLIAGINDECCDNIQCSGGG